MYPATASDAKGLLKSAIRDEDCVLYFEHKYLYRRIKEKLPSGDHLVPIGKARVAREGSDVSIITYAGEVQFGLITDRSLCPDPEHVIERFAPEFEKLVLATLMAPWPWQEPPTAAWIEQAVLA